MKVGARIFKTGISVILAIYLAHWLGFGNVVFAAVSAVLTTQPSLYKSWKHITQQVQANIIGALIGVGAVLLLGTNPVLIGVVVMLVISINLLLKLNDAITVSVLTVVAIMHVPAATIASEGISYYAWERFLLIMIGVFSSVLVNILFLRPKYEAQLGDKMKTTAEKVAMIMRNLSNAEYEEKAFKKDKEEILSDIKKIEKLYELYKEDRGRIKQNYGKSRKIVVFKHMIRSLHKNMEVVKSIHRPEFLGCQESNPLIHKIDEHIGQLVVYQEQIYMKYAGKIKVTHPHETSPLLEEGNIKLAEDLMEQMKNDTAADKGWKTMFAMVSRLIEATEQLDRVDKMIDSLYTHHNE